jgi:hypothetical protein
MTKLARVSAIEALVDDLPVNFVVADVFAMLPDAPRSSVSSALARMAKAGTLREVGRRVVKTGEAKAARMIVYATSNAPRGATPYTGPKNVSWQQGATTLAHHMDAWPRQAP